MTEQKKMAWGENGWFEKTGQQEEERKKSFHPSMSGVGLEPVDFRQEKTSSSGDFPPIDTVQIRHIPMFLTDRFRLAAREGTLPSSYNHYIAQLEKANVLDAKTLSTLKKFSGELKSANYKRQNELLGPLLEYVGSLKMGKRE
jgi:hypothetical protein